MKFLDLTPVNKVVEGKRIGSKRQGKESGTNVGKSMGEGEGKEKWEGGRKWRRRKVRKDEWNKRKDLHRNKEVMLSSDRTIQQKKENT